MALHGLLIEHNLVNHRRLKDQMVVHYNLSKLDKISAIEGGLGKLKQRFASIKAIFRLKQRALNLKDIIRNVLNYDSVLVTNMVSSFYADLVLF